MTGARVGSGLIRRFIIEVLEKGGPDNILELTVNGTVLKLDNATPVNDRDDIRGVL